MRLSVEAKVAATVAAGFVALTVGVIAQGNNGDQRAAPGGYGPSRNGYDSSLGRRIDAEENTHRTHWQLPESL